MTRKIVKRSTFFLLKRNRFYSLNIFLFFYFRHTSISKKNFAASQNTIKTVNLIYKEKFFINYGFENIYGNNNSNLFCVSGKYPLLIQ